MNKSKIVEEYNKKQGSYNRLGVNIVDALKTFFQEIEIDLLDVYYRVKTFNSFYEKISRKNYSDPFEEIEDICGIRVICYYASDIEKIKETIQNEFIVIEDQDKSELLGLKEFAYRSHHYIVKINNSWTNAPNYRRLDTLKAEIQVRTILMHGWAEIEHKLNYKSDAQVPSKFQRKLFRLSAKFEEADEQFDELRFGIKEYKKSLTQKTSKSKIFDVNQDFNIETYKSFVKFHFPEIQMDHFGLGIDFQEYSTKGIDFEFLEGALKKMKPYLEEIGADLVKYGHYDENEKIDPLEVLGMAVKIVYKEKNEDVGRPDSAWRKVLKKWKEKT